MTRCERVAFVCPRFAEGSTVGGAETLLRLLAERTALAGRHVTFLTTCAQNHFTWENEREPGTAQVGALEVRFFKVDEDRDVDAFLRIQDRISRGLRVSREEELRWLQNSVNSRDLLAHLGEDADRYDRIVAGPYLYGLSYAAAMLNPGRTILAPCLHDEPFAYLSVMHDLFHAVSGLIFNSEPEKDLATCLYGLTGTSGRVVGIGMRDRNVDRDAFRRRTGLNSPYIVYSGRREPLKGTPLLIDYFSAFRRRTSRDIKLVLTGSGLIDVPSDQRAHVLDLGFVNEREKLETMAGAVAFCHPSVNESLGIVLLESWLCGTPCLVHACSKPLVYQCRRSNGGLWFRNYPEFEEALILLMDDPDIGARLADGGGRLVREEYDWPVVEQRLLAAIDA